ncbi:hypothetical protein [Halonotius sp. GCM10025705]|uniref:hypothetical protein n=1 Tax=Halonotius sp. GCM10025705 TaxID=3252678 RepID=UPI00361BB7B6
MEENSGETNSVMLDRKYLAGYFAGIATTCFIVAMGLYLITDPSIANSVSDYSTTARKTHSTLITWMYVAIFFTASGFVGVLYYDTSDTQ